MIRGRYFDAQKSAPVEATLQLAAGGQWQLQGAGLELRFDPLLARVSDRIGSIPRRVHLPDGAEFETADNDGMDQLLGEGAPRRSGIVNALERRWGVAVAALAGVVLISFLVIRFGLPALADWAALRLPARADQLIGAQTLEVLDRSLLKPSRVDPQRQAQLTNLFMGMTAGLQDGHDYRLEFRSSRALGPNAVALPAGIIVVTDELVQIATSDEELAAVLAHEIGHVRGRHALRQIIQGAGVSILALVVLGDVGSVSAIASAAPVLIQAKHSRDFEREADGYARAWLAQAGIAGSRFDDILCRMTQSQRARSAEPPVFLSTHPGTTERVRCD